MTRPLLFAGAGTEVVVQVLLPAAQAIWSRSGGRWPEETFFLMADSDRRSQNRFREASLPQAEAGFVPMSVHQLREALSRNPEAFRDIWREAWAPLLRDAPDNGASALPALGRLLMRSAQTTLTHQLEEFRRQMNVTDDGPPDIFVVLNPLSGTSRGSVLELPRALRVMWPGATIHAILIYPMGIDRLDRQRAHLYATNFIEALRIISYAARRHTFQVYLGRQEGWQERQGHLFDNVIAFDGHYGNQRLKQLDVREFRLRGGVNELMAHVADFVAAVAVRDPLADALLSHLSNATLQRARLDVGGHPALVHALHTTRLATDQDAFRRALIERGVQRVLQAFNRAREEAPGDAAERLLPDPAR